MKSKIALFITFTLLAISCHRAPQLGKSTIEELLQVMSLEEKARTVVGTAKAHPNPPYPAPGTFMRPPMAEDSEVNTFSSQAKVPGAAGESYSIARFGIPTIVYADGPAGVRIDSERPDDTKEYFATAFPIATTLASSWDEALVYEVGEAMGDETREYGVDILLAPGLNIHRNPLTGRNFEYYSEDPLLAGKMTAAMVNGIQSQGVGTSIKHFAVNNQETYRNGINVIIDERTLREIYLKPFEIAIKESQPWTVMSSYNKINGEYASESYKLLTGILRDEWGYEGFVMTDWWGEHDPVAQMKAGNDLLMPGTEEQIQLIIEALKNKTLPMEVIDKNVSNILKVIQRTPSFNQYNYSDSPNLNQHASLVRKAAAEGMVLLKNEHKTLPLAGIKKIALMGISAYDIISGGSGSGYVHKKHKISLLQGMQESDYNVDRDLVQKYQKYIKEEKAKLPAESFWHIPIVSEMELNKQELENLANNNDMAIITIGRNSGEGEDRKLIKGDYYLTDFENSLISNAKEIFGKKGKKVVVILTVGGVIDVASWRNKPDAILLTWQSGQEAGYSIADVLNGSVTPSGKLPMTFPMRYEDVPSGNNFPMSDNDPATVNYKERIYVGYRHYNTFNIQPAYEFGYGLSYTQFRYSDLSISSPVLNDEVTVSVTITNTGDYPGKEVVQLYVSAPKEGLDKPAEELKGFAKTQLLRPGEWQKLSLTLSKKDLSSFDESKHAWITMPGRYQIKTGASSRDMRAMAELNISEQYVETIEKYK